MNNVKQIPNLDEIAVNYKKATAKLKTRLILCAGTGCVANGALAVRDALAAAMSEHGLAVELELDVHEDRVDGNYISCSGCQGFCQMGPLLHLEPAGILYTKVKPTDVPEIVNRTLINGEVIERLLYLDPVTGKHCRGDKEISFYNRQHRAVLRNCMIEPGDIAEYISRGGYFAARRAITEMTEIEICSTILESGLRGRGGGGFPTGTKWQITHKTDSTKKYIVCNGDEGDPGAFMDRSVMEGNPHGVIEGMLIAAKATGADEGYVYVRAEYPLAVKRMRHAVNAAIEAGLLGNNLFGTGFSFKLQVMEGAGAFVCGEETALLASIEGKRGMPMPKPPYPAQKGLWGKPTVINNVETLASVPLIISDGPAQYRTIGTANSPGTKTFALTGHVANTGLIEVPFGTTLREIVNHIGGGVIDNQGNVSGENFKSVQIGGPSGGCLTPEMLDMPLDFDSLKSVGAMVGSGGLVVMNNQTCMVRIARFFMQFTQNESCGKCVPCREGTRQMLALLDDIIAGKADANTLKLLEQTAKAVKLGSLCGLGKTAPNPVLSTLKYFRAEYEEHVFKRNCPTSECPALTMLTIDVAKCKGCTACIKACPVEAITGEKKQAHRIDVSRCIKCGACKTVCKFNAII